MIGNSEINDLDDILRNVPQDVSGIDIFVDNVILVDAAKNSCNPDGNVQKRFQGKIFPEMQKIALQGPVQRQL